ncbi:MAG TPA: TIGR01777 family oxidoreductase [Oceanipulchritudo sp.]|nr:TIGR01777 family oxidoreductase [Oceanipulchritudo sp.]
MNKQDDKGLPGQRPQRVLVTGSSGFIGRRLVPFLENRGYEVRGLTRGPVGPGLFNWNPAKGIMDAAALDGVDAVIHLAGENIAAGRWTAARKRRILASRVDGTRTLVEAMGKTHRHPKVLISASGVNFYQPGPDEQDETSPNGQGFLADVCRFWETEALVAQTMGVRTVLIRTGVVLDSSGGALARMLPAFKMGLGGPIGDGRQGFPWIGLDDLLEILEMAIRAETLQGPVNAVHPDLVTQREFSRLLGKVLHRPSVMRIPAFLVRLLFGQMGEEALLSDLRIRPGVLLARKHPFRFSNLGDMLAITLGRSKSG